MIKQNEGFTLVEMLVSIIAGTLATAAVATLLLLGIRMNAKTSEIATQDNQAVICLTVMEEMIKNEEIDVSQSTSTEIKIVGETHALFAYTNDEKITVPSTGAVLLEDVAGCEFSVADGLLTIELQLDEDEEPFVKRVRLVAGQTIPIAP